jgi:hypothetical protein
MIFISAGFDAHREDLLGGMALVEADYAWITREMMALAARHSQKRIVSMLEGGYNLSALGRSAVAHVRALGRPSRRRSAVIKKPGEGDARFLGAAAPGDQQALEEPFPHGGSRFLGEPTQVSRQLIETRFSVRGHFAAHALGPEFVDVIGDAGDGILAHRFGAKEVADVIRHFHQVVGAAVRADR